MSSIVHLESEVCDQVDIRGSAVDVEINGCRFVRMFWRRLTELSTGNILVGLLWTMLAMSMYVVN